MNQSLVIRHPRLVEFHTADAAHQAKFGAAVAGLRANVQDVPGADESLLIEGGKYPGMWLESGPIDARTFAVIDPGPYLACHRTFFRLQRDDGQVPCFVRRAGIGWSQVQTVTALAVTALDAATHYADEAFLAEAYGACVRWNGWLTRYRDPRGLDLCEAFCEYDTGHDNGPRFAGLPKVCRDREARLCPVDPRLPYLAPDLSASLYGGRRALSEMARRLGKSSDAAAWDERADATRRAIVEHLFDEESQCFYDTDATGERVRVVGDVLLRVLAEGVLEADEFDRVFEQWVLDPGAFWTPLPLPSIAANDPGFEPGKQNAWAGACLCLSALRAPAWFERFGRFAELDQVMRRWAAALVASPGFRQQADPFTGAFNTTEDYTPAMAVTVDFMLRLHGITLAGPDALSVACGGDDGRCTFDTEAGRAEAVTEAGVTQITWAGSTVATVTGRCRVLLNAAGALREVIGVGPGETLVQVNRPGDTPLDLTVAPNQRVPLGRAAGGVLHPGVLPAGVDR